MRDGEDENFGSFVGESCIDGVEREELQCALYFELGVRGQQATYADEIL